MRTRHVRLRRRAPDTVRVRGHPPARGGQHRAAAARRDSRMRPADNPELVHDLAAMPPLTIVGAKPGQ